MEKEGGGVEVLANAKLNLTLDVLGKREDGYHDLRMVMQSVALSDVLRLVPMEYGGVQARSNLSFLPGGEKNLAVKAALCFYERLGRPPRGLEIELEKHIPVCAGMGGGSSDAAAVLRALNEAEGTPFPPAELARVGEGVGSDVPYCVLGGTALAEGRGEVLTPLPALPPCWVVVCKPEFAISTPALFARIDGVRLRRRPDTAGVLAGLERGDLEEVARRLYNVFEDALPPRQQARVSAIKSTLIHCGALGASMTGTGPATFGLFDREDCARAGFEALEELGNEVFLTRTV